MQKERRQVNAELTGGNLGGMRRVQRQNDLVALNQQIANAQQTLPNMCAELVRQKELLTGMETVRKLATELHKKARIVYAVQQDELADDPKSD